MTTTMPKLPPCYKPHPRIPELCLNAYRLEIKRLDCKRCIEENRFEDFHAVEF